MDSTLFVCSGPHCVSGIRHGIRHGGRTELDGNRASPRLPLSTPCATTPGKPRQRAEPSCHPTQVPRPQRGRVRKAPPPPPQPQPSQRVRLQRQRPSQAETDHGEQLSRLEQTCGRWGAQGHRAWECTLAGTGGPVTLKWELPEAASEEPEGERLRLRRWQKWGPLPPCLHLSVHPLLPGPRTQEPCGPSPASPAGPVQAEGVPSFTGAQGQGQSRGWSLAPPKAASTLRLAPGSLWLGLLCPQWEAQLGKLSLSQWEPGDPRGGGPGKGLLGPAQRAHQAMYPAAVPAPEGYMEAQRPLNPDVLRTVGL